MKRIGGIGIVALLIVTAIVLYLSAKAWQAMAPSALDVSSPAAALRSLHDDGDDQPSDDDGQPDDDDDSATGFGHLPDLGEMKANTQDHSQQVQDAMDATN